MTALEIKEAFINRESIVYNSSSELIETYIKAVIYRKKAKSGRVVVSCELQDPNIYNRVIYSNSKKLKGNKPTVSHHSKSNKNSFSKFDWLKEAFLQDKKVILKMPNEKPIVTSISAIIYRRHPYSGKIMVSCELLDPNCKNCVIIARANKLVIQK